MKKQNLADRQADIGLILKRESIREEAEVEAATPDAEFTDIPEGSTSGWDFAGDVAQYLEQYSEDYEHDEEFAKRLLSFVPGDNNGHDAAKVSCSMTRLMADG